MTEPIPASNNRGIDSIAHLFLSQTRQPSSEKPSRVPPASYAKRSEACETEKIGLDCNNISVDEADEKNDKDPGRCGATTGDTETLIGEVVLAYHMAHSLQAAQAYAQYLGQRDERAALISLNGCEARLISCGLDEVAEQGSKMIIAETEVLAASLIPAVNEAAMGYDSVLINVEPGFADRVSELVAISQRILIISGCDSTSLIEAYQVLKALNPFLSDVHEVSLFIYDAPSTEVADETYYKFNDTSIAYLNRVIIPAGCSLREEEFTDEDILEIPRIDEAELEESFDFHQCCQDSQPIESQDVSGNYDADSFVAETFETQPDPNVAPLRLTPVKVAALPQTDRQLADALQLALPGWLAAVPTAIAIPLAAVNDIAAHARILIDATGKLHVLISSLSGANALEDAQLVRKWLCDNISRIVAGCRQLKVDGNKAPGVIIISGHISENLYDRIAQINDYEVLVNQVCFIDDSDSRLMVILP